ncbi:hypothetical protein MLD38_035976 [Melastoma candidum]|uniref:Uncharacterized protein n=1 Tax=Melastoma candidum TaxID=119954 RepID=A0ACB9LIT3_9MYRT|nr:hypothetical protein MLD38_035976 [Melastoma candidum]
MSKMKPPTKGILFLAALMVPFVLGASAVHVGVRNGLGSGRNMTLHCRSKDTDLGSHVVSDGDEFGWNFNPNIWGTTLFYCLLDQGSVQGYAFDAYSYTRDYVRCESKCLWLVAGEGIYGMNDQTGLWEYVYPWPASST